MIENYLKELLYDLDCVIIPGFGGFLCTYVGAEISISKNKICPPSKKIIYNDVLSKSDGKLEQLISEREGVTLEETKARIAEFVNKVKTELSSNSQFVIDSLGRFYTNTEGVVFFEQYSRINYLKESYGLPDLYFKPIDRTKDAKTLFKNKNVNKNMSTNLTNQFEEEERDEQEYKPTTTQNVYDEYEEEDDEDIENKKTNSLAIYYILLIMAFVFTAATTYYLNMDKETYAVGSFNPFSMFSDKKDSSSSADNKLLPENESVTENTETAVEEENSGNNNYDATPAPVAETAKPKEVYIDPSNIVDGSSGRYYIIAGGFKNKKKAASLLNNLISEGQQAKLIEPYDAANVYRVSVGDFQSYEEANTQKQQLASSYGEDLWILNY